VSDSFSDRFRRVDAIFDQALDLPVDQRMAFLEQVCAKEPLLCAEILRLFRAYERSESFLESPAVDVAGPLLGEERPDSDTSE
jgi:hypothetical protein